MAFTVEATMTGPNGGSLDATGVAEHRFTASQLYAPAMDCEVKVTDGSGNVRRSLDLIYEPVREAMA